MNCYIEFLKGINVKFKILIRNQKFNEEEYISRHISNSNKKIKELEIYNQYIEDLKQKLSNQSIYTSKLYICFLCDNDENKKDIDECINKLKSINLHIKSLSKVEIKNLMYESINKI